MARRKRNEMKEQKYAVSIIGAETTFITEIPNMEEYLECMKSQGKEIEFVMKLEEFRKMFPMSI